MNVMVVVDGSPTIGVDGVISVANYGYTEELPRYKYSSIDSYAIPG